MKPPNARKTEDWFWRAPVLSKNTLPKSQIGKAMIYAYTRWDALSAYLNDGNLEVQYSGFYMLITDDKYHGTSP